MKTVSITAGFTGYPNGKDKRHFVQGEEPELSDAYADLLVGKQLATEKPAAAPAQSKDPK